MTAGLLVKYGNAAATEFAVVMAEKLASFAMAYADRTRNDYAGQLARAKRGTAKALAALMVSIEGSARGRRPQRVPHQSDFRYPTRRKPTKIRALLRLPRPVRGALR